MSLVKIPFVLLFTYLYHASWNPPQPPPPKDELLKSVAGDIPIVMAIRAHAAKYIQILAAMVEITTIIVTAFPSWSPAEKVLSLLTTNSGKSDGIHLEMDTLSTIGLLLVMTGGIIRIWTFRTLGRFFRFNISIQKNHALITTGPYSWVRHPSYIGGYLLFVGWLLWNAAPGSWIRQSGFIDTWFGRIFTVLYCTFVLLGLSIVVWKRMSKEDAALRQEFGREWDRWAERVPYSIVPYVY